MVVVAVAGGSGHVGRTIVETLVEIGEHEVIVLGRKVRAHFRSERTGDKLLMLHRPIQVRQTIRLSSWIIAT